MNILLIGATGFVGSHVRDEALQRGHHVTAVVRTPSKLPAHANLRAAVVDPFDSAALAVAARGHDAVIAAFSPDAEPAQVRAEQVRAYRAIVAAVRAASVPRVLVVGGAGSLEVAPGLQMLDTPDFPAEWRQGAEGTRDVLHLLREVQDLDWTMLSPSAHIAPGERTGHFRLGTDQLLIGGDGESRISLQDYAVAMIDELETPAHARRRFTVGY